MKEFKVRPRKLKQILWSMFAGAALVFGLYAVNTVCAPDSKADADSYLKSLEMSGYYGTIGKWLTIGYFICAHPEYSDSALAYAVMENTGPGVYMPEGYEIIYIARSELCPGGSSLA